MATRASRASMRRRRVVVERIAELSLRRCAQSRAVGAGSVESAATCFKRWQLGRRPRQAEVLELGQGAGTTARSGTAGRDTTIAGCSLGTGSSSGATISSASFSPGRTPVTTMETSRPGIRPDSRISRSARSRICTGSPISSVKTSPPVDRAAACRTSCTASWTLMKYRVIPGR